MKIIIEHSNTKRQIVGSFNICGSRDDLRSLIRQLEAHLDDKSWSFGWTEIHDAPRSMPNTEAKHWDE